VSVLGIGYEGLALDAFVSRLRLRGVETLVDVRLNAISRKQGFSKKSLTAGLNEAGIAYLHLPALGNARDNREGYSETNTDAGDSARAIYRKSLAGETPEENLRQIARLARSQNIAVFCYEADEEHCHREQVIEAVKSLLAHDFVPQNSVGAGGIVSSTCGQ
jgi:uncharacterized protein (DUF488 family)